MKILVAGSHGLIGHATTERLRELGHTVIPLVRSAAVLEGEIGWNPRPSRAAIDLAAMEGLDAVINVGGVSIGEKRWTMRHKRRLWDSRIASTEILVGALLQLQFPPKVLISASAVGYYGDRGDEVLTEESSAGAGFLAELCKRWEAMTASASEAGMRVVTIRSGIVLAEGKGILSQQTPLFRLCLGGRLGSGQQYVSWISLEDEVEAIVHLLKAEDLSGAFNLAAPEAARNVDYTKALAQALNRPAKIPSPRWMIALALGAQMTDEVVLASQNAAPARLLESGFEFEDIDLASTFERIFNRPPPAEEEVIDVTDNGKRK